MSDKIKKKILVVEDEKEFLHSIQLRLQNLNYEVVTASNGREAISVALKESPQIILLDIHIPKGDGHTVLSRLKKMYTSSGRTVPIIYMTASRDEADYVKSVENNADGYLMKPFSKDQLCQEIEKAELLHANSV